MKSINRPATGIFLDLLVVARRKAEK
jgi:hypothetical protein